LTVLSFSLRKKKEPIKERRKIQSTAHKYYRLAREGDRKKSQN
jgi:hypothetical protein